MRRLEPLPLSVDQAHECDLHAKDTGGEPGKAIKPLFCRSIENIEAMQRSEALFFVWWKRWTSPTDPGS